MTNVHVYDKALLRAPESDDGMSGLSSVCGINRQGTSSVGIGTGVLRLLVQVYDKVVSSQRNDRMWRNAKEVGSRTFVPAVYTFCFEGFPQAVNRTPIQSSYYLAIW